MFPAHTVSAVEKGGESVASDTADILVVTRHYYENIFDPFDPPDVGLVTELDADLPLFEPSFRATEQALINAEEWRGVAHACRADFLLQSDAPDIFRAGLSDLRQSLSDDLKARQSYGRPPWRRTMTASYRTEESREAALALKALEGKIQSVSPRTDVESADGLRLSVPPDEIAKVLASFSSLDDRYIIDTNVQ
jgi:primosomal protein N'